MMKIDTTDVPGYEDKQVVLEFQHKKPLPNGRRNTDVRLVEVARHPSDVAGTDRTWRQTPSLNWKSTIVESGASCSPEDQYCREEGRRIAIRRLHNRTSKAGGPWLLTAAAIQQYFQTR